MLLGSMTLMDVALQVSVSCRFVTYTSSPTSNELAVALGLGGSVLNAVLVMEELKDNRCIGCV